MSITLATAVAILIITGLLWLVWQNTSKTKTQLPPTIVTFTGVGGISIAICSVVLSTSYGWSMAEGHPFLPVVFATIFASIAIGEFTSAYWLDHWVKTENAGLFILAAILMAVGIGTSILAGQAMIASEIDQIKAERRRASDEYQAALAERQQAAETARQLSVAEADYHAAVKQLEHSTQQANTIISNTPTAYADCSAFPTLLCSQRGNYRTMTAKLNQQLSPIRDALLSAKDTITRYERYQGAAAHAVSLQSHPLPSAQSAELPHIIWLSAVTGWKPGQIEAWMYITLAIIAECVGLLLLYFYGQGMNASNKRNAVVRKPTGIAGGEQLATAETGAYILSGGLLDVHDDELLLNASDTATLQTAMREAGANTCDELLNALRNKATQSVNNVMRNKTTQRKAVGGVYACEHCGKDYEARSTWQKYCSEQCRLLANGVKDKAKLLRNKRKKHAGGEV